MQMFTDFVKSELTEDQLLPTLRQLLPVLLNILGDAEVSMTYSIPLFGIAYVHVSITPL
jgi:hypothetical protein